jgi:hypothetical protein
MGLAIIAWSRLQWAGRDVMPELTVTFIIVGTLALSAAVFVALVIVGVRLANGVPILPHRHERSRRLALSFKKLKSTVTRARHYDGAHV